MSIERQNGATRHLVGAPATLRVNVFDDGDAATIEASPSPKVTVIDAVGATVVDNQDATPSGGAITYVLPVADTAEVASLTATWTCTIGGVIHTFTSRHELAGDLLFRIDELRAANNVLTAGSYPDAVVQEARDRLSDDFEEILGFGLGERYAVGILDGNGRDRLLLPHPRVSRILAVHTRERGSQTWTAFDEDELADVLVEGIGAALRESLGCWPRGTRNVRVQYAYGTQPIPAALRRAGVLAAVEQLIQSNTDPRAISKRYAEGETVRFTYAGGERHWFGHPLVDSVLERWRDKIPVVA